MKEAYAVRRTVPPSAEIEARIEQMLSVGVGENPCETLSELARLGAASGGGARSGGGWRGTPQLRFTSAPGVNLKPREPS